jgi:hypothetical protein
VTLLERHVVAPVIAIDELPAAAAIVQASPQEVSASGSGARGPIRATVFSEGVRSASRSCSSNEEDALGSQRVFLRRHGRSIYSARTDVGALTCAHEARGVRGLLRGIGTSFRLDPAHECGGEGRALD